MTGFAGLGHLPLGTCVVQAISRRSADATVENRAVVDALYDVAVAARQLSRRDPVDTAGVRLLWHLAESGPCRPSDLAELAQLDLSTVSRHVRDLGDAGLLTRSTDPRDGRAVVLDLTPDGREVLDESIGNRVAAVAPVLDSWHPDDRAHLVRLLRALADDLGTATNLPTRPTDIEDRT